MAETRNCPQCSAPFPADGPAEVCPRCMLGLGFGQTTDTGAASSPAGEFAAPLPRDLQAAFPQLEVLELIGQGGMGAVYRARQRGLDRVVALKILATRSESNSTFEERFAREAKALARLNHPNIVTVYDSGRVGDYFYLLMEFVDGVNLRHAIQAGTLTPREALAIVPQICEALQYAHDEGVVHRDIKPENVLVDRKGRVKVADFGLAKLLGNFGDSFTLTGTHQVMGTPRYMAPEQLEGAHQVDHRADIYSLGVVFYELLTGELPLGRFAPPSKKAQIDVRLDNVVLRTLEKEPEARYQQASEIKTAVEQILVRQLRNQKPSRDYRSSTTVFGLPLVHIATGSDPITGKQRVAKGIIALGDVAIGVVALGGVAVGGIACGGVSLGVLTLGGLSLGLIFALGGVALGCGLSLGGLAVGSIAAGGGAVGYYAYGGGAFGVHGYGGNARDPKALELLRDPDSVVRHATSTLAWCIAPIIACVVTWMLILSSQKKGAADRPLKPPKPPVITPPRNASAAPWVVLAAFLGVILLGCAGIVALVVIPAVSTVRNGPAPVVAPAWQMTERGPELGVQSAQTMGLRGRQIAQVNQILRTVFEKSVAAEERATRRTRDATSGQQIANVPARVVETQALENELWTQLDPLLTSNQEALARMWLALESETPLLGAGLQDRTIEIARVGEWYRWRETSSGVESRSGQGPELPLELRRFWRSSDDTSDPGHRSAPAGPVEGPDLK